MGFEAGARDPHRRLALVGGHHLHEGRLADDRQARGDRRGLQHVDQPPHPDAADFLVVAEGEMDGRGERPAHRVVGHGEAAGDEALHVGAAAAVKAPRVAAQGEGIAAPRLTLHRHHVGMSRQHDAGPLGGADGGVEVGFFPRFVGDQLAVDTETGQFGPHE